MIYFISGPMTGYPDYNRPAFRRAQKALEQEGHTVINPALLPTGLDDKAYMPICVHMIDAADAVYVLTGAEKSLGATAERAYAGRQGKKLRYEAVEPAGVGSGYETTDPVTEMADAFTAGFTYCVMDELEQKLAKVCRECDAALAAYHEERKLFLEVVTAGQIAIDKKKALREELETERYQHDRMRDQVRELIEENATLQNKLRAIHDFVGEFIGARGETRHD